MSTIVAVVLMILSVPALAQDYEREQRWADQTLPTLLIGKAEWLQQKNGHRFLALYTEAKAARGAAIIAHGRGWGPDFELYGSLRTKLADAGYTTLSIQLPVLGGSGKLGDYIPLYPDARERFQLAADFLKSHGYRNVAIEIWTHAVGGLTENDFILAAKIDLLPVELKA